jgi:O-antigen/teichoic acid export membrane protein
MFCLVSGGSLFLINADIFIVQHLFVGTLAGDYAAISVLSKFLLFLGTALESVYYPQLASKNISTVSRIQLRNYLILIATLIIVALVGAYFAGMYILYFYKNHLVAYHSMLMKLIVVSGGLFICTSFIKLFVAWRRQYMVSLLLSIGTI